MLTLADAKSTLLKVTNIIEEQGIPYWIDSGTLLSAYRDKMFNLYDHDIDLRVRANDVDDERAAELIKQLWLAGFRDFEGNKPFFAQILFCDSLRVTVDFKFCHEDDKWVWYYCWREPDPTTIVHVFPKKFFENLTTINLLGKDYPCPSPVEEYIEYHYGKDWQQFKTRIEEAEECDVSWDYMKDPPCCMTLGELMVLQNTNPVSIF